MSERYAPTRAIPELPPNFARHFIEGGWRQVERVYGCRDDVILAWMEQCGGMDAMQLRRRSWVKSRAEQAREKVMAELPAWERHKVA